MLTISDLHSNKTGFRKSLGLAVNSHELVNVSTWKKEKFVYLLGECVRSVLSKALLGLTDQQNINQQSLEKNRSA